MLGWQVSLDFPVYVRFTDGANRSPGTLLPQHGLYTCPLVSQLFQLGGIRIGPTTKNVAKSSAVI